MVSFTPSGTNFCSYFFQGLNLLELASHLERTAAQLHHEGLGRIKMALAGTNTSSLLEILEGSFGHVDLDTTTSTVSIETPIKKSTTAEKLLEKTSKAAGKTSVPPTEEGSLASLKIHSPCYHQSLRIILATLWS